MLNIYRALSETVHIAMVPRYYELISWRSKLSDLSGMPFLEIAQPHLSTWDQIMKRTFDIVVSGLILLITSPLLLVVAIGVKLSSPGPVFFRQVRLGRYGEPFTLNKFRSMTVEPEAGDEKAEELAVGVLAANGNGHTNGNGHALDEGELELAPLSTTTDIPLHELRNKAALTNRITRIGAILRKTGIDEIPQFVNVFKGDMSVVGPRPFVREESQVEGWATRRFEVRPGHHGSVAGLRRNDLSRSDLIQLDYLYVSSWSLWWDLKIMFETPQIMLAVPVPTEAPVRRWRLTAARPALPASLQPGALTSPRSGKTAPKGSKGQATGGSVRCRSFVQCSSATGRFGGNQMFE